MLKYIRKCICGGTPTLYESQGFAWESIRYYYSCDVNDREGMKNVISKIQNEVGRITGVVHGAGIVSDSKIWNKDMKSFERVFGTKYKGLNNIMDNVDKE